MKICVAQTRPVRGDVIANIERHKSYIALAVSHGADIIVFPELSLTGYEPSLAKALATHSSDVRFDIFQKISDKDQVIIGCGMPVINGTGISIGMLVFQPKEERQVYLKTYLHPDEDPFFISGQGIQGLTVGQEKIALAICYEISVPEHAWKAFKNNSGVYIASVAKFKSGTQKALDQLSLIAKNYAMTVFMSNAVGIADDGICTGHSSVWNNRGEIQGQLDETKEGILVMDTETGHIIQHQDQ